MTMLQLSALVITDLVIAGFLFPQVITPPPGDQPTLFLGGAGQRGLEVGGKFVTFTAIGVYLEESAVPSLAGKWKGKTAEELFLSNHFFRDIYTGPFERLTKVTMVIPLTGEQYSEKLSEKCVAHWKAIGTYNDRAKHAAIANLKEVFKSKTFPHGASILFTHHAQSSSGPNLTIRFLKNDSMPDSSGGTVILQSRALSEAILESIIGKNGVSPAAKQSLAKRISALLKESTVLKMV